MIKYRTMKLGG